MRRGGERRQAIERWLLGHNKGKETVANMWQLRLRDSRAVCDSCCSERWACEGGRDSWLGRSETRGGRWHRGMQNKQQNKDAQESNRCQHSEARLSKRCLGSGRPAAGHKLVGASFCLLHPVRLRLCLLHPCFFPPLLWGCATTAISFTFSSLSSSASGFLHPA